jgi:hypothetical protein
MKLFILSCLLFASALAQTDKNCEGFWTACTSLCETGDVRTWTETQAQSGNGDACPMNAPDCQPGDGSCVSAGPSIAPITSSPSQCPSLLPTKTPSNCPTVEQSITPSQSPATSSPSGVPSKLPTNSPITSAEPTASSPTAAPSTSTAPPSTSTTTTTAEPQGSSMTLAVVVTGVTEDNKDDVCQEMAAKVGGAVKTCTLASSSGRRYLQSSTLTVVIDNIDDIVAAQNTVNADNFISTLTLPDDVVVASVSVESVVDNSPANSPDNNDSKSNGGLIAGLVIAGLVVVGLIIAGYFYATKSDDENEDTKALDDSRVEIGQVAGKSTTGGSTF